MKLIDSSKIDQLMYLKADINYTELYFSDGQKELSARCLKHFNDMLKTENFLRINKSYLINAAFVKDIDRLENKYHITLKNGDQYSVARRCISEIRTQFMHFSFKQSKLKMAI